ncbi:HdeD family acid-resistance protein [Candidatus Spongiisocius sp.]|uniref:HdeD family acid-resistance protein n=1 Tax=Candidatus Spongiisocius sp. TaxID=3101273 RepID=UPI003B5C653C
MTQGNGGTTTQASNSRGKVQLAKVGRFAALSGIGSIVLGVLMFLWPGRTLLITAVLLGIHLIVSGLSLIVARVNAGQGIGQKILGIIAGVATVVIGLAVLRLPGLTLAVVALFVGAAWLVSGIFEVIEAVTDSDTHYRGIQIVGGLVTAGAGFLILVAPLGSLFALAVWGGVLMIAVGLARLLVAMRLRRLKRS